MESAKHCPTPNCPGLIPIKRQQKQRYCNQCENARRKQRPSTPCATKYCRGIARGSTHSRFCPKCANQQWKEKNPLRYFYKNLRNRAKQRGHEFKLTFEEYCEFALKTDYHKLRGKTKYSLSINRKNENLGYEKGNIEAMTLSENSKLRYLPPRVQAIFDWQNSPEEQAKIDQRKHAKNAQD